MRIILEKRKGEHWTYVKVPKKSIIMVVHNFIHNVYKFFLFVTHTIIRAIYKDKNEN